MAHSKLLHMDVRHRHGTLSAPGARHTSVVLRSSGAHWLVPVICECRSAGTDLDGVAATTLRVKIPLWPSIFPCWPLLTTFTVTSSNRLARDNATYNWPWLKTGSGNDTKWTGRPVYVSASLAFLYVLLGSCRLLLTKVSASPDGTYLYLPATVVVASEALKLFVCSFICLVIFIRDGCQWDDVYWHSFRDFLRFMRWALPGLLYCVDNLLSFYTLYYLSPAVVVLLSNFGIITTAILFRFILGRHLSAVQWASLLVLFLSIVGLTDSAGGSNHKATHVTLQVTTTVTNGNCSQTKSSPNHQSNNNSSLAVSPDDHTWNPGYLLIAAQCLSASFANVYNEKILKMDGGVDDSIFGQNTRLYLFGVLFSSLSLVLHPASRQRLVSCGPLLGHSMSSIGLIGVTAALGLTVAFTLKFRDNMFHVLVSEVTAVLVTLTSMLVLGFRPGLHFMLHAPSALLAVFVYAMENQGFVQELPIHRTWADGEETVRLTEPGSDSDVEDSL
uniref:UDP-sugar transporter protein SLC35A5 n=1 Tax=Myxine glutinosa TaxID=7769 RepID=UPI00358EA208